MHPGPMNRGIEIDSEVADDINRSVILDQVEMGVAVRQACLEVSGPQSRQPGAQSVMARIADLSIKKQKAGASPI